MEGEFLKGENIYIGNFVRGDRFFLEVMNINELKYENNCLIFSLVFSNTPSFASY